MLLLLRHLRTPSPRLTFPSLARFSDELWHSGSPLPSSDFASFSPYFDFKFSEFGQGGRLVLRMLHSNACPIHLHTLWEDFTEVHIFRENTLSTLPPPAYCIREDGDGREVYFSDEYYNNATSSHPLTPSTNLRAYACIPEYYSYDIESTGRILHESTSAVSSKIYGNVRAITTSDYQAKKLKTEKCEISAASVSIDGYLEGLDITLQAQANVTIKKLAVSGVALLQSSLGTISISAAFTNQLKKSSSISSSNNCFSPADITQAITQQSHIHLETISGNIEVGSAHGGMIITAGGNVNLPHIANFHIAITAQSGHVQAHFYKIESDSFVIANTATLSLEDSFIQNIFLVRLDKFFNDKHDPEQPTLFVDAEVSESDITIRQKYAGKLPSFMLNK